MQLFVRQPTGEIEPIAPMTLGAALHPILLTTGELMFSGRDTGPPRLAHLGAVVDLPGWSQLGTAGERLRGVLLVSLPGATIERRNRRRSITTTEQLGIRHALECADAAPGAGVSQRD